MGLNLRNSKGNEMRFGYDGWTVVLKIAYEYGLCFQGTVKPPETMKQVKVLVIPRYGVYSPLDVDNDPMNYIPRDFPSSGHIITIADAAAIATALEEALKDYVNTLMKSKETCEKKEMIERVFGYIPQMIKFLREGFMFLL